MRISEMTVDEEARMLDKTYVVGLECNLKNLITILDYAFNRLSQM